MKALASISWLSLGSFLLAQTAGGDVIRESRVRPGETPGQYLPVSRGAGTASGGTFVFALQTAPISESKLIASSPDASREFTWALPPADPFQLSAPPAAGSPEEKAELAELKAVVLNRSSQDVMRARYWATGPASLRWAEKQFECIIKYRPTPPRASRGLAILHAALHDAVVAAWSQKYAYRRRRPAQIDPSITEAVIPGPDFSYPSEHAVAAGVSSRILAYLYPSETAHLEAMERDAAMSRVWAGVNYPSDIEKGLELGHRVAERFIARAKADNAGTEWDQWKPADRLTGPGRWDPTLSDNRNVSVTVPTEPAWARVKPWLLTTSAQFRPGPPPVYDSDLFQREARDVEMTVNQLTEEQKRIAVYWSDGPGTLTPPGHWTQIALDLIRRHNLNTPAAARVLSLVTAAQADAFIACWDAKFTYWSIRPVTAIQRRAPGWRPYLTTPPFPSYISGHAAVSAAASEVLAHFFPKEAKDLRNKAQEAAISRFYGGIHFRSDLTEGLKQGKSIAQLAIQRDNKRTGND